jgi:predicted permease
MDGVLAFDLTLSPARYPDDESVPAAYRDILERIGSIPGVTSVGAASAVPFGEHMLWFQFRLEGRPPRRDDEPAWAAVTNFVMPGYFSTMGIPVEQGRGLTPADGAGAPAVGVINETMAHRFWPGENPVGKRWAYGPEGVGAPWITVVGVVPDQLRASVGEEALPQVYLPQSQSKHVVQRTARSVTVVTRGGIDPLMLAPAVRAVVRDFDPGLPVGNLRLMADAFSRSMARPRLLTYLLGIFAGITLTLALVGLYGIVAYSVTKRTREIGIRQALGATRIRILGTVLAEGTLPLALGIVLGMALARYAASFVRDLLYRVSPSDPEAFIAAALIFLGVGVGATLAPALRATGITPTQALGSEE